MHQSYPDSILITHSELEFADDSLHGVSAGKVPTPSKFWEPYLVLLNAKQ